MGFQACAQSRQSETGGERSTFPSSRKRIMFKDLLWISIPRSINFVCSLTLLLLTLFYSTQTVAWNSVDKAQAPSVPAHCVITAHLMRFWPFHQYLPGNIFLTRSEQSLGLQSFQSFKACPTHPDDTIFGLGCPTPPADSQIRADPSHKEWHLTWMLLLSLLVFGHRDSRQVSKVKFGWLFYTDALHTPEKRLPSEVPKEEFRRMTFEKNLPWGTEIKFSQRRRQHCFWQALWVHCTEMHTSGTPPTPASQLLLLSHCVLTQHGGQKKVTDRGQASGNRNNTNHGSANYAIRSVVPNGSYWMREQWRLMETFS